MTREERLSLAIARHFEKEPTVTPPLPPHPLMGAPCSKDGWWLWTATDVKLFGSTGNGHYEAIAEWIPADCTTPYNAMRLLKELLKFYTLSDGVRRQMLHLEMLAGEQLELAIAEAFAKAFNLEV